MFSGVLLYRAVGRIQEESRARWNPKDMVQSDLSLPQPCLSIILRVYQSMKNCSLHAPVGPGDPHRYTQKCASLNSQATLSPIKLRTTISHQSVKETLVLRVWRHSVFHKDHAGQMVWPPHLPHVYSCVGMQRKYRHSKCLNFLTYPLKADGEEPMTHSEKMCAAYSIQNSEALSILKTKT
jgi:hypothetical protein